MCMNLTDQVRSIAAVTTAVARVRRILPSPSCNACQFLADRRCTEQGNLNLTIDIKVEGEMATLKETVNSVRWIVRLRRRQDKAALTISRCLLLQMVAQLTTFAREVTRVALEVGTYGQLGGQAIVEGVEGTWADLTTNVNVRCQSTRRKDSSTSRLTCDISRLAENGRQPDEPGSRDCSRCALTQSPIGREGSQLSLTPICCFAAVVDEIGRPRQFIKQRHGRRPGRDAGSKGHRCVGSLTLAKSAWP